MDKEMYKQLVGTLMRENAELKEQLRNLVMNVPSGFLTGLIKKYPNDYDLGEKVRQLGNDMEEFDDVYIYESPDGGKTLYRRKAGDYDTPREQIVSDGNPLPTQMELF